MTSPRGAHRPVLRALLALVVALDFVSFFFFLEEDRVIGATHGTLNAFNELVSATAVRGLIVAVGVAAAIAFARRPGRLGAGAVALVALAVLSAAHTQLFGSPWRHLFFSGVCLAGWLLGLVVSRRRARPDDESWARLGAIALLGAAYLNAGLSKVTFGGLEWLSGLPIQAVIVAQDGLVPDGLLGLYRAWVVGTPAVASLLSIVTVALELAGPLMILGRIPRACVALGLFAMHANIWLLTPILYWEPMVLLLGFGLSSDGPGEGSTPEATDSSPVAAGRGFAAIAVPLAIWAVVAIGHQARRHAASQAAAPSPPAPVPSTPAVPAPDLRARVGPFAVGERAADGWTVETLEIRGAGVIVTLAGAPGRAAFEITCAATPNASPFDLGRAHVFYANTLPFGQLEPAGRAVRQRLRDAAAGREVCDALASWLAAPP